ncbi:MAG: hypothetical protein ACE37H_03235 [Phycisphaeraceae bacterium]
MKQSTITCCAVAASAVAGWSASAGWQEIDFDAYGHGRVLSGVDLGPATVFGDNFHNRDDLVVAFDTRQRNTRDRDLEGPNGFGGGWGHGNLKASNDIVGTILILQEVDRNFAGYTDASKQVVNRPDDEGRRRGGTRPGAGEITLDFDAPINAFGFTLIDVEETGEFNNETGFFATFTGGGQTAKVSFADFIDPGSSFYDSSVVFGNNSANRINPITADQLGLSSIDRVKLNLGGSGGVGEMKFTGVPSPSAVGVGLAMLGVFATRRRRKA